MNSNWAEENLQTIRTLMERSALYRRALAPIMLFAGTLGAAAAAGGLLFRLDSTRAFGALWLTTAVIVVVGTFLIARRQASKDNENFWSPPTRRVAQALLPPLLAGLGIGGWPVFLGDADERLKVFSMIVWIMFYGLALNAAGFFTPRGIRFLGWTFMASACGLFYAMLADVLPDFNAHLLMGFFFGVLHLAYGAYLYVTEKRKNAA